MVDLRRRDLHLNNVLDLIVKCSVAREDPRHLHKIASKLVKKLATLVVGHPPNIHLTSTSWHYSHDKCSQEFPVLCRSFTSMCIPE